MVFGGLDIWRIETTAGQSMMTADGNNLVPPIHPFLPSSRDFPNENPKVQAAPRYVNKEWAGAIRSSWAAAHLVQTSVGSALSAAYLARISA
jgi:hypothetical protein